jgi:hypothetical protein
VERCLFLIGATKIRSLASVSLPFRGRDNKIQSSTHWTVAFLPLGATVIQYYDSVSLPFAGRGNEIQAFNAQTDAFF